MYWRDLKVWKKSHEMVLEIYRVMVKFPRSEVYGLVSQIKRAAYSIPANIVEGQSRHTTKEYLNFLYNARGSLEEIRYFLLLSHELTFLEKEEYQSLENQYKEISIMLNALIKSLKKDPPTS